MSGVRAVNAIQTSFDLKSALRYLTTLDNKSTKKRPPDRDIPGLENPTFLVISNTNLIIDHDLQFELPDLIGFDAEVTLKIVDEEICVISKRRGKLEPVCFFKIKVHKNDLRFLTKEIKCLLNPSLLQSGVVRFSQRPFMRFAIFERYIHAEIKYSFTLVESIYLDFNNSVNTCLTLLMSEYIKPQQQSVTFSSKLFYDTITENTEKYAKPGTPLFINGLAVDLLPFQERTVNWLLSKEGVQYSTSSHSVDPIPLDITSNTYDILNDLSYGFKLIQLPFQDQEVWFNEYSNNICSQITALRYVYELHKYTAKGLLSEEMGLGKTVEILSLALLNKRPDIEREEELYLHDELSDKRIKRSKTTLIICPESILSQWVEEIELHAPGLKTMIYKGLSKYKGISSNEIVEKMSDCDIVVASFATLQREVHNAVYDPSKAKRLRKSTLNPPNMRITLNSNYFNEKDEQKLNGMYEELGIVPSDVPREDYTSPLVLIEFWRLVLDEVQMVGQTAGNVCTISRLIRRVHSWGVSGTPIKNDIKDLDSLVSFLRIHPFCSNKNSWKRLVANCFDLLNFFKGISFRHTKEMVSEEIKLPPQHKVLLSIPFGPIEQNNYDELYETFLEDVKLDVNGNPTVLNWEFSSEVEEIMRFWLKTLRRICCHANLGLERRTRDVGSTSFGYESIDTVLQNMVDSTHEKIAEAERAISGFIIGKGLVYEGNRNRYGDDGLRTAIKIWEDEVPHVESRIKKTRDLIEKQSSERLQSGLRSNLEALHRLYFFIGSVHYQLTTPPIPKLVPGIIDQILDETVDSGLRENYMLDPDHIDFSNVVVHRAMTEEESRHCDLETEFYAKAQSVRKVILSESMNIVTDAQDMVKNNLFFIPTSELVSYKFNSLEVTEFAFKASATVSQINSISLVLNRWVEKLKRVLLTPLVDSRDEAENGAEYNSSLDEQLESSIYLEYIQKLSMKRSSLINGTDLVEIEKIESQKVQGSDHRLEEQLESEIPTLKLIYSLKYLLVQSKIMLHDEVVDTDLLAGFVLQVKEIYDAQIKVSAELSKQYRSFNDLYNKKIVYYKQLQQISDSVRSEGSMNSFMSDSKLIQLDSLIKKREEEITTSKSRIRYLELLAKTDEDSAENMCVICRCDITIGSLLRCGHKYCKDCLKEWLGTYRVKRDCPMCHQHVNPKDIYHFTLNKHTITANSIDVAAELTQTDEEELFQVYHKFDEDILESISSIKIKRNYGSKINTILRQIIWLKGNDSNVQIVIYSQWTQMLQILSKALTQNNINFLGSAKTLDESVPVKTTNMKTDISSFKKDPSITCFLLNAKTDASGLNLVNATHVFICEPLIQTALELQAISRIHRIGQNKPTTIWMFSISGSVEESIMLLGTRKKIKEKGKLDTEELSKSSKALVGVSGEVVRKEDLWNAFFSRRLHNTSR